MSLAERVREARKRKGITQAQLGRLVGISQQAVGQIESGIVTTPSQWQDLAHALDIPEVEMAELIKQASKENRLIKGPGTTLLAARTPLGRAHLTGQQMAPPQTMPVMGHAAGSPLGQGHVIIGEPIEFVARPPWLENVDSAYAVYAVGESMVPRFYPGELLHVHPHRQPRPGDFVVAQIQGPNDPELAGYIKQFVRFDRAGLVLHQFNPGSDITFDTADVKALHKIIIPGLS